MRSGQMELNAYHSQKLSIRKAWANPKWHIPSELELERPPDDTPGQVLVSSGPPGYRPEILQPAYMADNNDGDWIAREMQDTVGLHEVSQAQVPGRVEAAKAIDMLRESDVNRLSVLHDTMRSAISEGFWQVLQLARQFVTDDVIVQTYSAEGLPEVRRFKSDVIKPGMRVRVTMGTGLARSRAAREDQLLLYWQNRIITDPNRIAQLLDMPMPSFNESDAFDMRLARNENLELANGTAVVPNSWDAHEIHLRIHNDFRKTHDYIVLDQDAKNKFEMHCQMHDDLHLEQMARELKKLQLVSQITMMQQQMGMTQGGDGNGTPPAEPEPDQQPAVESVPQEPAAA